MIKVGSIVKLYDYEFNQELTYEIIQEIVSYRPMFEYPHHKKIIHYHGNNQSPSTLSNTSELGKSLLNNNVKVGDIIKCNGFKYKVVNICNSYIR